MILFINTRHCRQLYNDTNPKTKTMCAGYVQAGSPSHRSAHPQSGQCSVHAHTVVSLEVGGHWFNECKDVSASNTSMLFTEGNPPKAIGHAHAD